MPGQKVLCPAYPDMCSHHSLLDRAQLDDHIFNEHGVKPSCGYVGKTTREKKKRRKLDEMAVNEESRASKLPKASAEEVEEHQETALD